MSETVSDALCRERQRVQDERFARDKERIEDLEKICEKLNRLSIEMGELIKKHDEELNHQSRRLQVIEQKPLRWWKNLPVPPPPHWAALSAAVCWWYGWKIYCKNKNERLFLAFTRQRALISLCISKFLQRNFDFA